MIRISNAKWLTKFLPKNFIIRGAFVSVLIILGLFGPWLTYGFDSYATLNPDTKTGQINYHSKVELNPLFGSMYKDDILLERYWFISPGTSLAGLLLVISASLCIFRYNTSWAHFLLFMVASLGIIVFFLSIGRGI